MRRIDGYMQKALHEAKVHTSWINPNTRLRAGGDEDSSSGYSSPSPENQFLEDFRQFQAPDRASRHMEFHRATGGEDRIARRSGFLSRQRDLGLRSGGSRQPPPGELRRAAQDADELARAGRARSCGARGPAARKSVRRRDQTLYHQRGAALPPRSSQICSRRAPTPPWRPRETARDHVVAFAREPWQEQTILALRGDFFCGCATRTANRWATSGETHADALPEKDHGRSFRDILYGPDH